DSYVATALNPTIKEPDSTQGCEATYVTSTTSKPVSSLTSRAAACSRDSPISTYPAISEKKSGRFYAVPLKSRLFRDDARVRSQLGRLVEIACPGALPASPPRLCRETLNAGRSRHQSG